LCACSGAASGGSRNPSIINLSSAAGFGFPLRTLCGVEMGGHFHKVLAIGPLNIASMRSSLGSLKATDRRVRRQGPGAWGIAATIQEESCHASIKRCFSATAGRHDGVCRRAGARSRAKQSAFVEIAVARLSWLDQFAAAEGELRVGARARDGGYLA
jgi:hypothetical protein